MAEEVGLGARLAANHLGHGLRDGRDGALQAGADGLRQLGCRQDLLLVLEELLRRARGEHRAGGQHEILRVVAVAGQLLALNAEHLDRHAAVGRYPVRGDLARSLGEAHRDLVGARLGEQALRQLRRQVRLHDQLADHDAGALGMRGAHRVMRAPGDDLALLRHGGDDAVDRLGLVGLGSLDLGGIGKGCRAGHERSCCSKDCFRNNRSKRSFRLVWITVRRYGHGAAGVSLA